MPSWPALHLSPYRHASFVPPATAKDASEKNTDVEAKPEVSLDEVDDAWFDAESRRSKSSLGLLPHGRLLSPRQVTMFSMAGSIGTNIFINTSNGLIKAGPLSLLIGYLYFASILFCVNMCLSEMTSFLPVRGAMHRFAGAFVDPALGFASSVNYWLLTVTMLCVEINALTSVLLYWVDESKLPMLNILIPLLMLAVYFVLNVWDTRFFGETEFWTSVFKCLLAVGLLVMTVFLMCGANPQHDAFGFRYWKHPGPMNEYLFPGGVGRFCSVVAAIVSAAFTFQGPDMVSNVAGDACFPRRVIPKAFKSVNLRLMVFFIGSALAVGILVPYNDPILVNAINNDSPGASRTAWVRALNRLGVKVLPDIINAVILTSIFSCGNANVFAGARALQSMATEGMLPRVVGKTNRNGVPYIAVCICLAIGLLSLMQVSNGSSQVLFYFFDITTSSLVVTWVIVSLTHICWRRAIKVQNFPVESLPYSSRLAPYASWYSFINALLVLLICGWDIFTKGNWSSKDFVLQYFALGITLAAYLCYKVIFRTPFVRPSKMDISHGVEEVERHEKAVQDPTREPPRSRAERCTRYFTGMFY